MRFGVPLLLSCQSQHQQPRAHVFSSISLLELAGVSNLEAVGLQWTTLRFPVRTAWMNLETLKACRLINSGGSAFPIISAAANLPFSREKKYRLGKVWSVAASRKVMARFLEGWRKRPLE